MLFRSQRYGFPGGGEGREGRHDVVLFERNGLRRHEFSIESVVTGSKALASGRRWGYRVREAAWSSDSNILALWVEKDEGDLGKLLVMSISGSSNRLRSQCNFGRSTTIIGTASLAAHQLFTGRLSN